MKKFFCIFFFLPLFSIAQNCTLKNDSDPITNEPKKITGFVPFSAGGVQLSISMEVLAKEINLFFLVENPSPCFNEYSTAVAYFEGNRTRVNLKNNGGGTNCQGIFQVMYRNAAVTPGNLDRLSQKKISSIQFKANPDDEKLIVVNLTAAQQQQLMDMLLCIIKEAKTMVK